MKEKKITKAKMFMKEKLLKNAKIRLRKKLFMKAKRNLIVRFVQLFSQSNKVQNNTF